MNKKKLITIILISFLFFLLIIIFWLAAKVKEKTDLEIENSLNPKLPEIPLDLITIENPFDTKDTHWYSDISRVHGAIPFRNGILAATEGGMVYLSRGLRPLKGGKATFLVASSFFKLVRSTKHIWAIGKKGVVGFDIGATSFLATSIDFDKNPFGGISDAIMDNDELFILSNRGALYKIKENVAVEICQMKIEQPKTLGKAGRRFYVGSFSGKLYALHGSGNQCRIWEIKGLEDSNEIRVLFEIDDILWIGAAKGIYKLDDSQAIPVMKNKFVTSIGHNNGEVLFGAISGNLYKGGKREPILKFPGSVNSIYWTDQIKLAATDMGLFEVNEESGKFHSSPVFEIKKVGGIKENYVTALCFYKDRLIVGGLNSGLTVIDTLTGYTQNLGPELPGVSDIKVIRDGVLGIGATNGFYEITIDGKVLERYTKKQGLIHQNVTGLLVKKDEVYCATAAGLSKLDIGKGYFQSIYVFHGLINNHLYALAEFDGDVWTGTLGGLCRVGGEGGLLVKDCLNQNDGLTHTWVAALSAKENRLYIGTYGGGILAIDKQGNIKPLKGFSNGTINLNAAMVVDNKLFWGSLNNGLLWTEDGKKLTSFISGLPSKNVTALASNGNLLAVGTDQGLVVFPIDLIKNQW